MVRFFISSLSSSYNSCDSLEEIKKRDQFQKYGAHNLEAHVSVNGGTININYANRWERVVV